MPDNCKKCNCRVHLFSMQKDLPTLSLEQFENIQELDIFSIEEDKLIKNTGIYPDKLSIFLKNYLDEINSEFESKIS